MIDLESHIYTTKIKWVKFLTDASQANWKCIADYFLNVFGPNFLIFSMNPDSTKSLEVKILPEYYKNLIEVWLIAKEINQTNNLTFYQIRKEIIWGNRFIKFKNKCLFFKAWMNSNINYINDLLNTDGIIDQNLIFNKLHNKTNYLTEIHTTPVNP